MKPGRRTLSCEDRDNIREEDHRAPFLLLPFTEAQIKTYLKATLPNRDPDGVMQVIASIHNLTEMAERPYTLSLIVQEFETIERWKAEGRVVTGVTLYLRHTPDGPVWATVDHRNNRILACHPEAWRILGWRSTGPDGMPAILPAETFGPLPVARLMR